MIDLLEIERNDSRAMLQFLAEQKWTVGAGVWRMLLLLHDDATRDAFVDEAERLGPVSVIDD